MTRGADYDVVVIGAGAAGLSAALEAARSGASVLVAEAGAAVGGSSALSGGMFMAAGTQIQRNAGIDDGPEALAHDYLAANRYGVMPSIARRLAFESAPALAWLIDLGVEYHNELAYASEEPRPRAHVPKLLGAGVVAALHAALRTCANVDIALGNRVDRLLSRDGAVTGVSAAGSELRCGAVVVASGGFGANVAMWAEHLPSLTRDGSAVWYVGSPGARGDAIGLGAQVGAQIVGHDRGLVLLTPNLHRMLEFAFPGWLVVVDRTGQRRLDESSSYSLFDQRHREHGPFFAIFDDAARRACASGAWREVKKEVPGTEGLLPSSWSADNIDAMLARALAKQAPTVGELATALSVDCKGLAGTLDRYNRFAEEGVDADWCKEARFLRALDHPPYYGVELRRGILLVTAKGLRTDAGAHVLTPAGRPIPGLFAAGECTGGVIGDVYMGSGNSYTNCVVFGRVAGRNAAARRHDT